MEAGMATNDSMAVRSVQFWRHRAEEARTRADAMRDPDSKAAMLKLAALC
jgi:hypothetical protein